MDTSYTYTSTYSSSADSAAAASGVLGTVGFIYLAVIVLAIVSMWVLFHKAKKPGWASIIPIYNVIVELQIIGRPIWWILLLLVPVLNIWITIVVIIDLAHAYGKGAGTAILMLLLPYVGFPYLAFSKSAQYVGPVAEGYDGLGPAPQRAAAPAANGAPVPPPMTPAQQPPQDTTPPNPPVVQ